VRHCRLFLFAIVFVLLAASYRMRTAIADEWQPISPEELKMTSVAEAPGAPAVILYRQVDRDDSARTGNQYNYVRIKILTEEGRKYGDVEIPFFKEQGTIHGLKARTIRPDGTIANFEGKAFDKTIVKAKGLKYLAKTFTLPDVQVGSVIEYHYTYNLQEGLIYDSHWILSDELFTKHAKFSLKAYPQFALRWSWPAGLPAGTSPPKDERGMIRMETQNVPAFQFEDYMPPENELKMRVDFTYSENGVESEPEKFWKKEGKKLNDRVEGFIGKRKALEQAVAQIVSASDTPEAKLRKIYARAQQVRNTSFEVEKTEQEQKREKEKGINNVEDLLNQGYGNARQINWLFVGLARAAGFQANSVYISSRSQYFFKPAMMNASQLNGDVTVVKLDGKDIYCDPGSKFAPFGLLPWEETFVKGLRLDKDGGGWVDTSLPPSSESKIERKAELRLNEEDGSLSGKLTVTFSGLEALWRRNDVRNEDETSRKKFLEDQVREYIPAGIDVELKNQPEWNAASPTLVAVYDLKVPGWASAAGRRALLPFGLFGATEKQLFEHANRVHAVYFQYPFEKADEVTIQLPLGWQVSSVPKELNRDAKAAVYIRKVEDDKGTLHLTRVLRSDLLMVEAKFYPALRAFFQTVRTGDEEQIIVQPMGARASN
jgi:transglutaminase-like putative cysteine protease